jgi:hypothetical protein
MTVHSTNISAGRLALALIVCAFGASATQAQYGTGSPVEQGDGAAQGPAPARDLTGVWMRRYPAGAFRSNATLAPQGPVLTDWGKAKFAEVRDSNGGSYTLEETNDPVLTRCYPPGVPRVYFHPYPFQFVHTPKDLIMLFEYDHTVRRIYTDGRGHPEDPDPLWLGHSIGRWESDTVFVVDTVGFNEKTWLDRLGYPHSEQLHVVERFERLDMNNVKLDITLQDPRALAEPWVAETMFFGLAPPSWELGEISCSGDYLDFVEFESFIEN